MNSKGSESNDGDGRQGFLKTLADLGEEPAFVSRARAPRSALDALIASYRKRYEDLLLWPRRHFTALKRRVGGSWCQLRKYTVGGNAIALLEDLALQLPELEPYDHSPFQSERRLLRSFVESGMRFNLQWQGVLDGNDLDGVNEARQKYNDFYPIEKAAAFGTDRFNVGFEPLPMLESSAFERQFPLLVLPEPR